MDEVETHKGGTPCYLRAGEGGAIKKTRISNADGREETATLRQAKQEEELNRDTCDPDESASGPALGCCLKLSPGGGEAEGNTSYWSQPASKPLSPPSPFLLPSPLSSCCGARKHGEQREERASRPGKSRIPGRDHRRYYHEYWRTEFLMDFEPQRHGMICMVCGSSLATLKLSTIKRHIRQKHPDSLLWSQADKEVIRSGWEAHLSLEGGCGAGGAGPGSAEVLDCARRSVGKPHLYDPKRSPQRGAGEGGRGAQSRGAPGSGVRTLERYLNEALHSWLRQEFLMEYHAEASRLVCMVCGNELPSLHLEDIKRHLLDVHPNSLIYTPEEKHSILRIWGERSALYRGNTVDVSPLNSSEISIKSEPETDGETECDRNYLPREHDSEALSSPLEKRPRSRDPAWKITPSSPFRKRHRLPAKTPSPCYQERWRLDYLVTYIWQSGSLVCMVCGQPLPALRLGAIKKHIQHSHPESASLGLPDRKALAEAWSKGEGAETMGAESCSPTPEDPLSVPLQLHAPLQLSDPQRTLVPFGSSSVKEEHHPVDTVTAASPVETSQQEPGALEGLQDRPGPRRSHYPGKDQRRNYQVRWKLEYLMDYDCRRHGLVCMVCGGALATLKVSTIKRHIQQMHPHSLQLGPQEKQDILQGYSQSGQRSLHSQDCFSTADRGKIGV
ncbi:zinc finger translocation-associated protein-like isoform X2 [Acipenser ruthenus]|uniref:zinc finger translocation-associated protein-like isoform X2 n=1 Tax=Acipenser ruthenus TaxID=7906 RepID=UPI002741E8B1|nr:zinc finger translocation-associated protein-like isoform X2 [Acipenser ruthenus]